MVLKKLFLITISILFLPSFLNARKSWWKNFIQTAFSNSNQVSEIKNSYANAVISKLQYKYSWFPKLLLETQASFTRTNGNSVSIINQEPDPSEEIIINPYTVISINQKMPGNGNLSFSVDYGFNYAMNRRVFLQNPSVQLSFNQNLGQGAFGIPDNPESRFMEEQFNYSKSLFEKQMLDEFYNIIFLIRNVDELTAEERYYEALTNQYKSEIETAALKAEKGMQSGLESFYAQYQYNESLNKLSIIKTNKEEAVKEISLLFSEYNWLELNEKRNELKEEIDIFFNKFKNIDPMEYIELNIESSLYKNIFNINLYQYQNNENNYSPVLFISSSARINNSLYYQYSDFYKSFRILNELENPYNISLTIGISKQFELPQAKTKRKTIYEIQKNTLLEEFSIYKKNKEKEFSILLEQINFSETYLAELEKEIQKEEYFRIERKKLFENNLITQNEYFQSETLYLLIYKNYISAFWNIICDKIKIINLCSIDALLINSFLGDNYESVYYD
ncbi:MAG: hypothetical protein IKX23_06610 [Treponema sp.]|nr:hypothetical protein [Treponema sp.]